MIPQIIPLTSGTPRLRQRVSRSPGAERHANAMALRYHQRRVATRSAQTLEANMSRDTANHPAHQRHAAFTPACFALPSGTPHANALSTKAAQIPMALRHHERRGATRSAHTLEAVMRAFRTTLPPKVTRQVSTMNVSYETSSESYCQVSKTSVSYTRLPPNTRVRSLKTSVSYETSSKTHMSKSLEPDDSLRLPRIFPRPHV